MKHFLSFGIGFLGLFFSIEIKTFAEEKVKISNQGSGQITLTAQSCETLLKEKEAMCRWKNSVDGLNEAQKEKQACVKVSNNLFSISLSQCLPNFTKEVQNKKLINDGPNCWGTSMSFLKLSPKPRFMWPEEMQYWMESPLCRKLNVGEEKQPGDLINIFAPEKMDEKERQERDAGTNFWQALYPNRFTIPTEGNGSGYTGFHRLLHTSVYISPGVSFGKDSPSKSDPFYFHSTNDIYGRSGDPSCQENQNLDPHIREYQKAPQ